jgi:hypothetical protein
LKIKFDLANSTSLQEKIFWNFYLNSLRDLESQINSEEVKLCIGILKKKNKFHLTASFDTSFASVKKKIEAVSEINSFFKTFPIQEMMISETIEEVNTHLSVILINLKGITNTDYEGKRVYELIEIICKDTINQLFKILGQ